MRKTNRLLATIATLLLTLGVLAAFNTSANAAPSDGPSAGPSAGSAAGFDVQSPATSAYQTSRRRYFGAIHVNYAELTGGIANDKRTKRAAKKIAKRKCRRASNVDRRCNLAVWVRNGCGAVAVRMKNGRVVKARSAIAFQKKAAVRKAKRKVGRRARVYAYVCTTRYR